MIRWLLGLVVVWASFAACSGESFQEGTGGAGGEEHPGPCNEYPWKCQKGQTCAIGGDGFGFVCVNSGARGVNESCQAFQGSTECADGLLCFHQESGGDVCSPFCDSSDPKRACPDSALCVRLGISGVDPPVVIHACEPPS